MSLNEAAERCLKDGGSLTGPSLSFDEWFAQGRTNNDDTNGAYWGNSLQRFEFQLRRLKVKFELRIIDGSQKSISRGDDPNALVRAAFEQICNVLIDESKPIKMLSGDQSIHIDAEHRVEFRRGEVMVAAYGFTSRPAALAFVRSCQ